MPHEFIDSKTEMEEILRQETIGWLGLSGDGGPYVVPLNYAYVDGRILFHCALEGLKLDRIRANPEVCLSVGRQSGEVRRHAGGGVCHVDSDSVICFGRARILDDIAERTAALNAFQRAFRPDAVPIPEQDVKRCGAVEIVIREMTGRRERARQRTFWRYVF
jgi:nitroimidazol reductase NimA-like FMN-containing flavoprotein (pyridoxamine 5'-phosphate oxidase superfamily)